MHPPWVSHGGPETEFYGLCCAPQPPPQHTAAVTKGKKAGRGSGISDGLLTAAWQPSSSYSCSGTAEPQGFQLTSVITDPSHTHTHLPRFL